MPGKRQSVAMPMQAGVATARQLIIALTH